jgi:CheY-like chemotaxis protein
MVATAGTVDSFATIAGSIAHLLSAIAWPTVVAVVVLRFFPEVWEVLRKRFENSDVTVKAGIFELNLAQSRASALLGAAVERSGSGTPEEVASAVAGTAQADPAVLARAAVLWVDDHPENNEYERASLRAFGIRVVTVLSNTEAEQALAAEQFSVVITDLGRDIPAERDPDAGYKTVALVRKSGRGARCIVYAGRRIETEADRLRAAGAVAATNRPAVLLEAVVDAITLPG